MNRIGQFRDGSRTRPAILWFGSRLYRCLLYVHPHIQFQPWLHEDPQRYTAWMGKTTHNEKHTRKLMSGKDNAQWKAYSESKPQRHSPRKRARCSQQTTETSVLFEQDNQPTTEQASSDKATKISTRCAYNIPGISSQVNNNVCGGWRRDPVDGNVYVACTGCGRHWRREWFDRNALPCNPSTKVSIYD